MTINVEVISTIFRSLAYIFLYFFIGFGPGIILGIVAANTIFGRGAPTYADTHREAAKQAAQHNAQWNPAHERWQKQPTQRGASRASEDTGVPEQS